MTFANWLVEGAKNIGRDLSDLTVKYVGKPIIVPAAGVATTLFANSILLNMAEKAAFNARPEVCNAIYEIANSTDTLEAISKGLYYTLGFAPGILASAWGAKKLFNFAKEDIIYDRDITSKDYVKSGVALATILGVGLISGIKEGKLTEYLSDSIKEQEAKQTIYVAPQKEEVLDKKLNKKELKKLIEEDELDEDLENLVNGTNHNYSPSNSDHKQYNFDVMNYSKIPVIIPEMFFVTNKDELKMYSNTANLNLLSYKLAKGIYKYVDKNNIENVVLSVGHGNLPGAEVPQKYRKFSKFNKESDFNRYIVNKAKEYLEKMDSKDGKDDFKVHIFDYDNKVTKNKKKTRINETIKEYDSYQNQNAIAVEVHCNSSKKPYAKGFWVYGLRDEVGNPKTTELARTIHDTYNEITKSEEQYVSNR